MNVSVFGADTMERRFNALYPLEKVSRHAHPKGYVYLHLPRHPFADAGGKVLEHRAVIEQEIGRFLYPTEVVHHRNRNRSDNSLKNLQVIISHYEHMLLEHSSLNDKKLVELVLKAAADPQIALVDLPCAPATARRICSHHGVEWVSAAHSNLDEEEVKRLLKLGDNKQAAASLGVSVSTLRRNFPHLFITSRPSPGFLEKNKEAILRLRQAKKTYEEIAILYGTNKVTIGAALRRWHDNKPMQIGRKRMNFLSEQLETIIKMLRSNYSMQSIADHFETSVITLREQLYRWKSSGQLPEDIDKLLVSRMRRKKSLKR